MKKAAGVLLALAIAAAAQAQKPLPVPHVFGPLRGGQRLWLSWSRLPANADEFEILLSVDGGESFPLRLTPRMDPQLCGIEWMVPNLPARQARLRIRYGVNGKEFKSGVSGPFEILFSPGTAVTPVHLEQKELWVGREERPPLTSTGFSRGARFSNLPGGEVAAIASGGTLPPRAGAEQPAGKVFSRTLLCHRSDPSFFSPPQGRPLRI